MGEPNPGCEAPPANEELAALIGRLSFGAVIRVAGLLGIPRSQAGDETRRVAELLAEVMQTPGALRDWVEIEDNRDRLRIRDLKAAASDPAALRAALRASVRAALDAQARRALEAIAGRL